MKLYRFKFLTAETLGTMGTSFGRSDFRDLLGGQALVMVGRCLLDDIQRSH